MVPCTPAVKRQARSTTGWGKEGLRRSAMTLESCHLEDLTPCCGMGLEKPTERPGQWRGEVEMGMSGDELIVQESVRSSVGRLSSGSGGSAFGNEGGKVCREEIHKIKQTLLVTIMIPSSAALCSINHPAHIIDHC